MQEMPKLQSTAFLREVRNNDEKQTPHMKTSKNKERTSLKKGKTQEVPQSQTAAFPRHQHAHRVLTLLNPTSIQ